jgi:hypothetical protein
MGEEIKNDFESRNAFDEFKISSDEPAFLQILSLLQVIHGQNLDQQKKKKKSTFSKNA